MTVASPTPQRRRLEAGARAFLRSLCERIPSRHVGSAGNRDATELAARTLRAAGFSVETPEFDCLDWQCQRVSLRIAGRELAARPSPFSTACAVDAPLRAAAHVDELAPTDLAGSVLLLHGPVAARQLLPKRFPFYRSERDSRLIAALEAARAAAIVAATAHDPSLAGGPSPFPLFEDGDFDIPSVYLPADEAGWLLPHVGRHARLEIEARRLPARACNVVARIGPAAGRRLVVTAHIDAKRGSSGALDNASGATVLLLLGRLLEGYQGGTRIELVALNGEDHYDNPGERDYLERNRDVLRDLALVVNIDGVGYRLGATAFSLYGCPPPVEAAVRATFGRAGGFVEGEPWYQGDHAIFLQEKVPAVAFTSERARELLAGVLHTPRDAPELVDPERLAELALRLRELVTRLDAAA